MDVSPRAYVAGTFENNHKPTPEKFGDKSKVSRYFQDKSAIKLNQEHADDITKADKIPLRLEDGPASINNINDPSNRSFIARDDLIHPLGHSITDSTIN